MLLNNVKLTSCRGRLRNWGTLTGNRLRGFAFVLPNMLQNRIALRLGNQIICNLAQGKDRNSGPGGGLGLTCPAAAAVRGSQVLRCQGRRRPLSARQAVDSFAGIRRHGARRTDRGGRINDDDQPAHPAPRSRPDDHRSTRPRRREGQRSRRPSPRACSARPPRMLIQCSSTTPACWPWIPGHL
jgi:hypothetical protein